MRTSSAKIVGCVIQLERIDGLPRNTDLFQPSRRPILFATESPVPANCLTPSAGPDSAKNKCYAAVTGTLHYSKNICVGQMPSLLTLASIEARHAV